MFEIRNFSAKLKKTLIVHLTKFENKCIFAEIFKNNDMARDIAPTPPLHGQDAIDFIAELEKNEKVSEEERKRIFADAEIFKSWLTFKF